MKKIYDEQIIDFYKRTIDVKEIFENKNYLSETFEKIEEFCVYKKISFDDLIETFKELTKISIKSIDAIGNGKSNSIKSSEVILQIILWPIFNDKNFKNKKYNNYNIDILFFDNYLKELYVDAFNNEENNSKTLIDFKFEKKKLKYLIYEAGGGVLHLYEKNKLKKMIFCDDSEIEVPENI